MPEPTHQVQKFQADAESPSQEAPARILVVDDIADNRAVLSRRLQRRGFSVTEASNGHEALDLVARSAVRSHAA